MLKANFKKENQLTYHILYPRGIFDSLWRDLESDDRLERRHLISKKTYPVPIKIRFANEIDLQRLRMPVHDCIEQTCDVRKEKARKAFSRSHIGGTL